MKHDVLVDLVHISEGGKMQISLKLELCRANQDQIRNQRPRLRRNRLILVKQAGRGVFQLFFNFIFDCIRWFIDFDQILINIAYCQYIFLDR